MKKNIAFFLLIFSVLSIYADTKFAGVVSFNVGRSPVNRPSIQPVTLYGCNNTLVISHLLWNTNNQFLNNISSKLDSEVVELSSETEKGQIKLVMSGNQAVVSLESNGKKLEKLADLINNAIAASKEMAAGIYEKETNRLNTSVGKLKDEKKMEHLKEKIGQHPSPGSQ